MARRAAAAASAVVAEKKPAQARKKPGEGGLSAPPAPRRKPGAVRARSIANPLLHPRIREEVLRALAAGAPIHMAAQAAGIGERTLQRALAAGRAGDPKYASLVEEWEQAEGQMVVAALEHIQQAREWTSKAWLLERRFPDTFGRRDRRDVTVTATVEPGKAEERLAEILGATVIEQVADEAVVGTDREVEE